MSYLAVEEYHVRLKQGETLLEGKMWLHEGQEWEVEAEAGSERLTAKVEAGAGMQPQQLFQRVVENLGEHETRLMCCGTCSHFRRSPAQEGQGWMGFCGYQGEQADAPIYPGEVALLAPDCHAFEYEAGEPPLADEQRLAQENNAPDPENTKVLPAIGKQDKDETKGFFGKLRGMLGLKKQEEEMVRAGVVERPGGQPCPVCGTRMTNRASVANADQRGEERVLSVWRCPHCAGNYLDDWFEAYIGSRAHDAERLYVVPPVEANEAAAIVVFCPRPDVKGCTCIANQHFDKWGDGLEKRGRRIRARESVVSL